MIQCYLTSLRFLYHNNIIANNVNSTEYRLKYNQMQSAQTTSPGLSEAALVRTLNAHLLYACL